MTDKKNDLTRIEDLGEFLHDFSADEEAESASTPTPEENSFEPTDFGEIEASEFNSEESFESTDFGTSDFAEEVSEEAVTNQVEDIPFAQDIPEIEEAPPAPYMPEPVMRAPETFEEVKLFAENSSFSGMGVEGNPSFSVLLKNIRYVEDVNDILSMLRELSLLSDSEEQTRTRLMRGHLLVPRISEYAAIFLAHKLRRFDIDIQVGLSDEIHPPKHHEAPELGLTSKGSLYQNQSHHFKFDDTKLELSQIIVAATPSLEGYQVMRYLGVASEHKMMEADLVEDETSSEIPKHYQELAGRLKAHALKARANAVVGLNYQLTPLPSDINHTGQKYRLSCTGNLVWVNKL